MKAKFVVLLLCLSAPLWAEEGNDMYAIDADSVQEDRSNGVTTYEGNARAEISSLVIEAETIEIVRDNGSPSTVEASGNPLSFRQQASGGSFSGTAQRITLSVPELKLTLIDYEVADPSGNTMKGGKASFVLSD